MTKEIKDIIYFIYDGHCPICQFGASFYKIRKSVGELITIDARTEIEHQIMKEIYLANLDLDEGMIIKYQDNLYQGRDALYLMAKIGADDDLLNKINNILYRNKALVDFSYPIMKSARNLILKIKNISKINNLKNKNKI